MSEQAEVTYQVYDTGDKGFKVYDFLNYEIDPEAYIQRPRGLDLKKDLTIRPVKKDTIEFGERIRSEHFEKFENGQYLNLILRVDHVFTRNNKGLVEKRDTTVRWVCDDDTLEDGLVTTKYYPTEVEKYDEIKRRRYNIVYKNLVPIAQAFGLETEVVSFFEANQILVNTYIDTGSNELLSIVNSIVVDQTTEWFDRVLPTGNTPRQALQLYLQIGSAQ